MNNRHPSVGGCPIERWRDERKSIVRVENIRPKARGQRRYFTPRAIRPQRAHSHDTRRHGRNFGVISPIERHVMPGLTQQGGLGRHYGVFSAVVLVGVVGDQGSHVFFWLAPPGLVMAIPDKK